MASGLRGLSRLEAMILVKAFAVLVELAQKTGSEEVTSEKPFFTLYTVPVRSPQMLILPVPVLFRP